MTDNERQRMLERWMIQYGDDLLRLCVLYLHDRQLAEDAFQETMLKAWRAAEREQIEYEKTWLTCIAMNVCRDTLRRGWLRLLRRCLPIHEQRGLSSQADEPQGEVTQAVLSLPGRYREVIVMQYYQQLEPQEIAGVLGVPVNTVYTRLRRGRNMLAKRLKEGVSA